MKNLTTCSRVTFSILQDKLNIENSTVNQAIVTFNPAMSDIPNIVKVVWELPFMFLEILYL